jgi:hypothetical protein
MDLSSSRQATSRSVTQEFPKYFLEPYGSLLCSHDPATDPYPETIESRL